jgi:3-oxoacyl-[acyl-carrier protein] reductase
MQNPSKDRANAVITGGTRGIGLGIAESLARRGAAVAITYQGNDQAAQEAKQRLEKSGGPILLLKGDVGDVNVVQAHYQQVRDEFGPITVLVNNAGIMPQARFDQITTDMWDQTIRINLSGSFYWSAAVVEDMKEAKFGRIVNVSSIAAHGGGVIGPHYAASKAGMIGMTKYAARELGEYGITVNAIAPAFIEDAGIFAEWSEEQKAQLHQKVTVPRIGLVSDVVRAFDYLFDSPFVNGVIMDVAGGA